jgi:transposase
LKNNIDNLELSRFILISDRGIFQYRNLLNLVQSGNGYIVAKSLLKSTQKERDWAYDDKNYVKVNEDFKYKSRVVKRTIKDEDNVKYTIEEKVVVYWSKKFQQRAEKENKSFLDFINKLKESPANFRLTALQNKSIRKFLKKEFVNKTTGEILNSSEIKPMLDYDKIKDYKKSLGYYQIVTSELKMDSTEVIDKYHGLTQIEEQFRTMKSTLETRPLYVRTPEHIEAHLLICLIALILLRIIQKRIISSNQIPLKEDMYWSTGLNGNRIQEALNKWQVDLMPNELYRFMNIEDEDLSIILKAFDINIPKKLFTIGELKNIKTNIKIFI